MKLSKASQDEAFAALYAKHHLDLLRYVLTLVPDRNQAEDIVQETARLLWQKSAEYDSGQPFWPWARQFAYFEVLKHRKKQAFRRRLFSDQFVELLADDRVEKEGILQARRNALDFCLGKLGFDDKLLLLNRYGKETSLKELSKRQGVSANSIYLAMHRIRKKLLECVNRRLHVEGWT